MENTVRQSGSLCAGEKEYVDKRKQVVLESLKGFGVNCTADDVPHIALVSPGGGQRSAVALLGTLQQMEEDKLLDTLIYLGGISGSTWSMSFLYSDPEWSTNMSESIDRLINSEVSVEETLAWLVQKSKDEDFSLSHVWGAMTSTRIMKQLDMRCLSGDKHRSATNPYPVYCAIEKHCLKNGPIQGQWFEFTPHEAGFTDMECFVETSLLGSKFEAGKLQEQQSEMDMVELQGIFGSALADMETDMKTLKHMTAEKCLCVYNFLDHLLDLLKDRFQFNIVAVKALDALKKELRDVILGQDAEQWASMAPEERKHQAQQLNNQMLAAAEDWNQNLAEGSLKSKVTIIWKLFPLLKEWEWGTTASFLYKYNDPRVPSYFQSEGKLHLVDAGLHINTPYPPFLGKKRQVDLIIAPEFSAGEMFETLTLTRDYAATLGKPFPLIEAGILTEKDHPRGCYVFEGSDQEPTVIYLPLFNKQNCKDAEEIKARKEEFTTFQLPYSPEKIHKLLEIAKANILNNRDTLREEIKKAALRKQSHKTAEEELRAKEKERFRLSDYCWGF